MQMKYFLMGVIASLILLFTACKGNAQQEDTVIAARQLPAHASAGKHRLKKGDLVPHDEVCMVNDAYMGKKQLAVSFEGKTYYGCCQMCRERIPGDERVRVAIDPVSGKKVDKADAVIAITGDNGDVSYFENKGNYQSFFEQ